VAAVSGVVPDWAEAPARNTLTGGAVHVWLAIGPDASASTDLEAHLPADERHRARRLAFERDRRRFVFAHYVLRATLSRYLAVAPIDIAFSYTAHGKPMLAGESGGRIEFNMSHSDRAVLIAVSTAGPVGVDIEAIRDLDDRDDIARRTFAPGEFQGLSRLAEGDRTTAFFTCWTRKEAFVKALGEGLSHPLDRFEVTVAPGQPAALVHVDGDARRAAAWTIAALPCVPGFATALAVAAPVTVSCFRWTEQSAAPAIAAAGERCMA
jgi:4'-phosphopantetheinyl transferase